VVTLVVTRKLTKRVVDASTAKAERFIVWDAELKGFGLLVLPRGVKSYIYKYRTGGVQRRATIGQHGAWTADQARRKAEDMRHVIRSGEILSALSEHCLMSRLSVTFSMITSSLRYSRTKPNRPKA
jgi:hypothetical protein